MPRRNFNDGQELSYVDFNAIGPAIQKELYDLICYELVGRVTDAFFGDSLKVEFATSTSVTVKAGTGFQYDNTQVSPEPMRRLLYNAAQATKNLSAADATHPRKDIICVKAALVTELSGTRRYKDPGTSAITNETMVLQKEWEADIIVVTGVAAASPAVPATPAGYLKIATCTVNAVTGMSGAADVTDQRTLLEYGANAMLNTSGYERITASANIGLGAVMLEVDGLLDDALDDLSSKTSEIATLRKKSIEDWDSTRAYVAGDVVQDASGNLYRAIAGSTNVVVTTPASWAPLVQISEVPVTGTGSGVINCQLGTIFSSAVTGAAKTFAIHNMRQGQAITVVVASGAADTTVAFTAYSDAGTTVLSSGVKIPAYNTTTMSSNTSIYNIVRIGNYAVVAPLHGLTT